MYSTEPVRKTKQLGWARYLSGMPFSDASAHREATPKVCAATSTTADSLLDVAASVSMPHCCASNHVACSVGADPGAGAVTGGVQ